VFFLVGCNNPTGGSGGDGDEATDVTWSWGSPGYRAKPANSEENPGVGLALSGASSVEGVFGDITLYNEVIIEAYLYANAEATTPVTAANGLAWFKLTPSESEWNTGVSSQINNMNSNGETTGTFSATTKPTHILVQTPITSGVDSIEIRKLTLKLDKGLPSFEKAYDNGAYLTISGNKITFDNATYSDAAIRYDFPADTVFTNKKVKISWKIEGFDSSKGYQIQVQAANGEWDYNGRHNMTDDSTPVPQPGQFYITLHDKTANGNDSGTFEVDGNALLAACAFNSNTDSKASGNNFPLTAIRINNNGKNESSIGQMEKSYSIFFNSITVE
jgi:hypothetical protein